MPYSSSDSNADTMNPQTVVRPRFRSLITSAILILLAPALNAQVRLTVQADQPGAMINPAMWGIFFEDINLGADGSIYEIGRAHV